MFLIFDEFFLITQSQISIKFFDRNLRFCDRKNIFSSNVLFFPKTCQICSIFTKYEGITPKTPKVRTKIPFFLSEALLLCFTGSLKRRIFEK